jgi:D-psicose/D-tagatose/L-ribulose 3-epimerase
VRVAVSNIAWEPVDDDAVSRVMREGGATGVELAPTKRWPNPLEVSAGEARAYRAGWERRGLEPVAMQALLFGRPDLVLFGDPAARDAMHDYLDGVFRLAEQLGTRALVFGSPKSRLVGTMARPRAWQIAVDFFGRVADRAGEHDVVLCLEANPVAYGCDFLTTSTEALDLVRAVSSAGLGAHLDTGGMTMNDEPVEEIVAAAAPWLRHFHASEPNLAPVGGGTVNHERYAAALLECGYDGWVSVEMRGDADAPAAVRASLARVVSAYAAHA